MQQTVKAFVEEAFVSTHLCVLKARVTGETLWVLLHASASRGTRDASVVGVLSQEAKKAHFPGRAPKGHAKDAARSRLLEGGTLSRLGKRSVLVETPAGTQLVLVRGGKLVLLANEAPEDDELPLDEARAAGGPLAREVAAAAVSLFRIELSAALKKALVKVDRRAAAVEKDLAAMAKADDMLLAAQWLVPLAQSAKRGQAKLTATDWAADPPRELEVTLDPARSPKEQIDAMFKRARRLKAGRVHAEPRLAAALAQSAGLRAVLAKVAAAGSLEALSALAEEARTAAPKDFALTETREGRTRKAEERERGHRVYTGADGARILVGRTSLENDALTFKLARPHDVWLHAKGRRGAHVIVPRARGEGMPADLLVDAAHLAAHFSEAKDEAVVDVEYTHRKFLRKPKGGAPGLVVVEREKVLAVRIEKARLAALLGEGA